jgi:hypothetical protein
MGSTVDDVPSALSLTPPHATAMAKAFVLCQLNNSHEYRKVNVHYILGEDLKYGDQNYQVIGMASGDKATN